MTWFRNIDTGREFQLNGRMAAALAGAPEVQEIDAPGGSPTSESVATVSDSDPALKTLRKADLETLASDRGLDTFGSKADLISRISADSVEEF